MSEVTNPCEENNDDADICRELVRIFGRHSVKAEWNVCSGATDDLRRMGRVQERYCPRIDFAIGPFNKLRSQIDIDTANLSYNVLLEHHQELMDILYNLDKTLEEDEVENLDWDGRAREKGLLMLNMEREQERIFNGNPRCFLAIEIERTTREKHVLGGIVHASGLGKIGIIVTDDAPDNYRRIMRIRRYLRFLVAVGKGGEPSEITLGKNTILLPRQEFLEVLQNYQPTRRRDQ